MPRNVLKFDPHKRKTRYKRKEDKLRLMRESLRAFRTAGKKPGAGKKDEAADGRLKRLLRRDRTPR